MDIPCGTNDLLIRVRNIDALLANANDATACLSPKELERFDAITSPHRGKTWLAGRYLAKMMACYLVPGTAMRDLELCSTDESGRGIPPYFTCREMSCPLFFSMSHSDREVAVAMSRQPKYWLGIDLIDLSCSSGRFGRIWNHWLTGAEKKQVFPTDRREIARRWALKEAAYKSMRHTQTGFSPLRFEVLRDETLCGSWHIRYCGKTVFRYESITTLESTDSLFALVCRRGKTETSLSASP